MSFVRPETPSSPDCVFSSVSTSDGDIPSFRAMTPTIAGSRSPERVPITRPSSGVMPIDVSTEDPALIAAAEQPFPRCSVMMLVCSRVDVSQRTIAECYVAMRGSMESVPPNAMPAIKVIRNRVKICLFGK